ncbi:MAG: hypothetical protein BHV79_10820 [Bacteroides uniformis]|uniref:Uncharacterized protein n=1 Tax=Bacteroides uniformis TaxID=820 RepID=A0A1Q6HZU7_BACUN|nr:MAG: hypothetical protein BHV79_10820 [Bacteroides uniformis]
MIIKKAAENSAAFFIIIMLLFLRVKPAAKPQPASVIDIHGATDKDNCRISRIITFAPEPAVE